MLERITKNGSTSVIVRTKLYDSLSTSGEGLTGLTSASTGLIISTIADNEATATAYTESGGTIETITTLGTYAAPTATKCRFKEIDATNHPGLYEIHFADSRYAVSGAKSLEVSITGAVDLVEKRLVIQLDSNIVSDVVTALAAAQSDLDILTGTDGATLATSQPNYAPATTAQATAIETDTQDIQSRLPAALVGGRIDSNTGAISADSTAADNLEAMLDGTGGVNLNLQQLIITAGDALPNIVLAGSGSADGIAFTRSGSGDPFDANFAAQLQSEAADALIAYDPPTNTEMVAAFTEIKGATWSSVTDTLELIRDKQTDVENDTQDLQTQIGTDGAGLTALPWNAAWDAEVQSEVADALIAYDPPTNTEMEARTPSAAQLAYIVANASLGLAVTFNGTGTTSTGVLALVDGATPSSTDNIYNGRILIFNNHEPTRITAYNGTSKTVTVVTLTSAISSSRTARMV